MSKKTLEQNVEEFFDGKKQSTKVVKRTSINLVPAGAIMAILWGMGVIVANGFWATLAALCIPFIGPAISVLWLIEKFTGGQ